LYKQDRQVELAQVLYSVLESVRLAAYLLSPIVPKISTDIYHQLGLEIDFDALFGNQPDLSLNSIEHQRWGTLTPNHPLGEPRPIFAKLDLPSTVS
jgi:methionyl-tRNA synthetase